MAISGLNPYFSVSATVAGSLIGLLFIAITLRYDLILGPRAPRRNRALAASAFIGLADAVSISLWALIPHVNLGYPAGTLGAFSLYTTFRTHFGVIGQGQRSTRLFLLSTAVYLFQLAVSLALLVHPHATQLVYALSYLVFAALVAALTRSWALLQAEDAPNAGGPTGRGG